MKIYYSLSIEVLEMNLFGKSTRSDIAFIENDIYTCNINNIRI